MEKLKLSNGQEFDLIPMGITQTDKRRFFKFTSTLTYAEILAIFSNADNISSVDYILSDGTTTQTYLDCVALKGLGFQPSYKVDELTTADVYTAEISIDAVERALQTIRTESKITADALEELIFMILEG